ncbi:MAG TPA: hypothetical protein VFI08_06685 [Spirochaetia bacterium]|nr:hypothetical protein [Spirochaetia bacterium]
MLQFYFLSVAANLIAGAALSSDWISERFSSLSAILRALSARRARMVTGLLAIGAGLGTLFVPAAYPVILGDLFPSVVGIGAGIALLFEALRQEVFYSTTDAAETAPDGGPWRAPRAYRTAVAAFAFAAAVLHFFLPERIIL